MSDEPKDATIGTRVPTAVKRRFDEATNGNGATLMRRWVERVASGEDPRMAGRKAETDDELQAIADELEALREDIDRSFDEVLSAIDGSRSDVNSTPSMPDTHDRRADVEDCLNRLDDHLDSGKPVVVDFRAIRDLADVLAISSTEAHERYRESRPDVPDAGFVPVRATPSRNEWDAYPTQYTGEPFPEIEDRLEEIFGKSELRSEGPR